MRQVNVIELQGSYSDILMLILEVIVEKRFADSISRTLL